MLLRLMELDADDWPMYKLLGVLGKQLLSPHDLPHAWNDRSAGLVDRTIRNQQIPRGRDRLLEQLQRQAGHRGHSLAGRGSGSGERSGGEMVEQAVTYAVLRFLADALDQLPRFDTLAAHARAWEQLAERVGIFRSIEGDADTVAWNRLRETLRGSQQLVAWLGQDVPRLDRKQAYQALLDIVNNQSLGAAGEESGFVRVLSAASVRHLQIPYLFVAGLAEKAFPAAERDDGVYSAAEHQRLIEAGLPLPSRSDRQTDEMLLFYETITSATRRLYLSYPAVDESGEPLTPSPYVQEVEKACEGGEGGAGSREQEAGSGKIRISRFEQIDLSPVPEANDLCSLDAFRIRAVFDAIQGKSERLAGNGVNSVLFSGLEFSLARQNRDRFGTSEGVLSNAVAASLATDFPRERVFNATELERYAYCPYQFFLNKVLDVQPLEEVELEVDYRERGQMAHELLAAFHRRVNAAGGSAQSPVALAPDEYQRLLAETIAETLSPGGRDSLADALREVDRRILLQWLQSYRQQHEKYDAQWKEGDGPPRPTFFEVSFGKTLQEDDSPPSTDKPLELVSRGQVVRVAGRIDRIDLGEIRGQPIFNILDYKSGSGARFSLEACQRGTVLQLPLYAMAATELILNDHDALPWQTGYWYLSGDGFKPRQALRMYELVEDHLSPSDVWESIRGILAGTVVGLVEAMRAGQFPVWSDDPDCTGRCPYKTVCRINQIRSLEKTWRTARDMKNAIYSQQERAISASDVSVALAAGAGCGKTFVLTQRFLACLDPGRPGGPLRLDQLTAITFTERAAREMRQRIRAACTARLLDAAEDQVEYWLRTVRELDSARIATIHSFCGTLLRSHAVEARLDPHFQVLDATATQTVLYELIDEQLRQRLALRDEAVIDLVVQYGLAGLREMVGRLLAERQQIDWDYWRGETPSQLLARWEDFSRNDTLPRVREKVGNSPAARAILRILGQGRPAQCGHAGALRTALREAAGTTQGRRPGRRASRNSRCRTGARGRRQEGMVERRGL